MQERDPIRVVIWGLDATGLAMAQLVWRRPGLLPVGAIGTDPGQVGRDLGELVGFGERFGVTVGNDPMGVLTAARADVTLISAGAGTRVAEAAPKVLQAMEAGSNVICLAEEMTYPWATRPDLADSLDELAHAHGVTVLGTGVNPGFVMDTLAIALTGCCMDVERIKAMRAIDLKPVGAQELKAMGIGMKPSQYNEQQPGPEHVGLEQSIHLIADALGWSLDRVEQDRRPLLAESRVEVEGIRVDPGQVAGRVDAAIGYVGGLPKIVMEHPQSVGHDETVVQTGDYIDIEGKPSIRLSIQPEIHAVDGAAAIAVNMIAPVLQSGPGLKTMADMPVPRAVLGDLREMLTVKGPTIDEELAVGWHVPGLGGHEEGLSGFPGESTPGGS
ncbi:MAG TPA: NADP-binding protein [Symbiobacteriaceae bacterium]|nr:NADP-binding protein [Symbiobacteriaceae bacterium]